MSTWVKYLIGLALALPMGAYVAGSLMASAADDPVNRDPVRIQDGPSQTPRPADEPTRKPPGAPDDEPGEDREGGDDDSDDDVDDNGVRVVTPQPTRVDGGDDDDAGDDDERDDRDDGDDDDESRDRSRDD